MNTEFLTIEGTVLKKCAEEATGKIVIPEGITEIGSYAFEGCSSLTEVVITESVTEIDTAAFRGCLSLTKVVIPENITKIGITVFMGCSALESIVVDSNNKVYDSRNNCNAIIHTESNSLIAGCKNTIIPEGVTEINFGAFYGCSTEIVIPEGVTEIGDEAFGGCPSLESIVVDPNNKVYDSRNNCNAIIQTESNSLIAGCKNTIIPESVTVIGTRAFARCTSLTEIVIPENVTEIGDSAFWGCKSLAEIVIPESVTEIGKEAFTWCKSLKKVSMPERFKGKEDEILDSYPRSEIHFQSSSKVTSSPKATSKDENRDEKEKICLEYLKEEYDYSVTYDKYEKSTKLKFSEKITNPYPEIGALYISLHYTGVYDEEFKTDIFTLGVSYIDNKLHSCIGPKVYIQTYRGDIITLDEPSNKAYDTRNGVYTYGIIFNLTYEVVKKLIKEHINGISVRFDGLKIDGKSPYLGLSEEELAYMTNPIGITGDCINEVLEMAQWSIEYKVKDINYVDKKDNKEYLNENFYKLLDGTLPEVNKLRRVVELTGEKSKVLDAIDEILNTPNISEIKKEISEHPGKVEKKTKFAFRIILIISSVFTIPAALLEMWWLIIGAIVIGVVFGVKYSIDVPLSPEATKLIDRVKEIKNVK